jgi:hypothetical protein
LGYHVTKMLIEKLCQLCSADEMQKVTIKNQKLLTRGQVVRVTCPVFTQFLHKIKWKPTGHGEAVVMFLTRAFLSAERRTGSPRSHTR